MKRNAFRKGVTLIEVLITSIIMVISMTGTALFIRQNAELSSGFQNRSQVYNKINLVSRLIESNIKNGSKVEIDKYGKSLKIFGKNNTFIKGYLINGQNKLHLMSRDGNDQGSISPILDDCSFAGSSFTSSMTSSTTYVSFDLKVDLLDKNLKSICSSQKMTFYAKCRSL